MESIEPRSDDPSSHHHSLEPQEERKDTEQLETESIASALEGSPQQKPTHNSDLERATTRASGTGPSVRRVQTAADWDGPDDPGNPLNWPLWIRAYHTFAFGLLGFAVTTGSSIITPATAEIAQHFNVSQTAAILPLTLYVLGLAFGPVVAAPLSETFGRNVVYKITPPIWMLFLLGSGLTKSFAGLLVCRLFAGIIGAPVLALAAGSSADMYPMHHRAVASVMFVMMPFLGPAVGPVVGGFAAQYKDWRWTQYCDIFIGIAAFIAVLPMRETYKKIILTRRAKKHGIPGPPKPCLTTAQYMKLLLTVTLVRPIHMLCTEPIILFLSVYNAFTFSVLFAFFAAYPYTFESVYGFTASQTGLTFLGLLVGVLLAVATAIFVDRQIYYKKYYQRAQSEGKTAVVPERRLYCAMLGALGVPVGLFWFAWTARSDVHWISPVMAGIPFGWGNLCVFISAALYLIDVYGPMNGASAMAANGLSRYSMGAVFPLFTIQMYETLGIDWATSLLGFISVAMIPIPWVFYRYGPKIRVRSGYDTVKF